MTMRDLTDPVVELAVFCATLTPAQVRAERWVDPPSAMKNRLYDMQTEAHLATIRLAQKEHTK